MATMTSTVLAAAFYRLYKVLVEDLQFQGDVWADIEGELKIWEGNFSREYSDIENLPSSFVEDTIAAFASYRAAHPVEPPPAMLISEDEARRAAERSLKAIRRLAHWHLSACDLQTQRIMITDTDIALYQRPAWKVWFVSAPGDDDDTPWPTTENFYIALPVPTPHIIQ